MDDEQSEGLVDEITEDMMVVLHSEDPATWMYIPISYITNVSVVVPLKS